MIRFIANSAAVATVEHDNHRADAANRIITGQGILHKSNVGRLVQLKINLIIYQISNGHEPGRLSVGAIVVPISDGFPGVIILLDNLDRQSLCFLVNLIPNSREMSGHDHPI